MVYCVGCTYYCAEFEAVSYEVTVREHFPVNLKKRETY